jgi:hypothetical protein
MFLLDTNVLSALMLVQLPAALVTWRAETPSRLLYTAAVCQAEILAGIAVLPAGRRRSDLLGAAREVFENGFAGKIWPFDPAAAEAYAEIFAARRRAGRPTKPTDLMIAAIALAHDASIITRNVRDFDGCGVAIVNPWEE